jgi:hypothetical protein
MGVVCSVFDSSCVLFVIIALGTMLCGHNRSKLLVLFGVGFGLRLKNSSEPSSYICSYARICVSFVDGVRQCALGDRSWWDEMMFP